MIARFVENAVIEARHRITVAEHVKHSELSAVESVEVGTTPGRGKVVGGLLRASTRIQAQVAGTTNEVPTTLEVGSTLAEVVLERTWVELEQTETEHGVVVKLLTKARGATGSAVAAEQHERRRAILARRLEELITERDALEAQLRMGGLAEVIVRDRAHSGLVIRIADKSLRITSDRAFSRFRLVEGEIETSNV